MDKKIIKENVDKLYAFLRSPDAVTYTVDTEPQHGSIRCTNRITLTKVPVSDTISVVYGAYRPFVKDSDIVPVMSESMNTCMSYGVFSSNPEYFFAEPGALGFLYMLIGADYPDEENGEAFEYFVYTTDSLRRKMEDEFNEFVASDIELNGQDYKSNLVKADIEKYMNRQDVKFLRESAVYRHFLHKQLSDSIRFDAHQKISASQTAEQIHMYLAKRDEWFACRKTEIEWPMRKELYLRHKDFEEMLRELKALEALSKSDWRKQLRDVSSTITDEMDTVIVTIRKGKRTCKVHYPANYLRPAFLDDKTKNVYRRTCIKDASMRDYDKAFGKVDFTCGEIAQITYKKKTIYKKVA